jgi:hypothetical protein
VSTHMLDDLGYRLVDSSLLSMHIASQFQEY